MLSVCYSFKAAFLRGGASDKNSPASSLSVGDGSPDSVDEVAPAEVPKASYDFRSYAGDEKRVAVALFTVSYFTFNVYLRHIDTQTNRRANTHNGEDTHVHMNRAMGRNNVKDMKNDPMRRKVNN